VLQHVSADEGAESLAVALASRGLHVLVDLNGHTRGSRLDAVALRPAPVSATWLG
jgi:predicted O-linked N-acetylglucosamine transferase (SPINDLY family)